MHYYPRDASSPSGSAVPEWLEPLAKKGVLLTLGTGTKDIGWLQKIQSYELVVWCAKTVATAAMQFTTALAKGETDETKLGWLAGNALRNAKSLQTLIM